MKPKKISSFIFILIALLGVDGENQFSVEQTPEGALVRFKPPSDFNSPCEHIKSLTNNVTQLIRDVERLKSGTNDSATKLEIQKIYEILKSRSDLMQKAELRFTYIENDITTLTVKTEENIKQLKQEILGSLKETLKPLAYSFWSTELNSALDQLQADLNDRPTRFDVEDISLVLTKTLKLMQKSDLKIKRLQKEVTILRSQGEKTAEKLNREIPDSFSASLKLYANQFCCEEQSVGVKPPANDLNIPLIMESIHQFQQERIQLQADRKEIADILCQIKQERLLMKNDAEHFALLQKEKMDHLLYESSSKITTLIETAKTEISRTVSTSTETIRRETERIQNQLITNQNHGNQWNNQNGNQLNNYNDNQSNNNNGNQWNNNNGGQNIRGSMNDTIVEIAIQVLTIFQRGKTCSNEMLPAILNQLVEIRERIKNVHQTGTHTGYNTNYTNLRDELRQEIANYISSSKSEMRQIIEEKVTTLIHEIKNPDQQSNGGIQANLTHINQRLDFLQQNMINYKNEIIQMVNRNLTQLNAHLNSTNEGNFVDKFDWIEMNQKFNHLQQQLTILSRKVNRVITNTTTINNTTTITINNSNSNATFQESVWIKITDLEESIGFLMEQLRTSNNIVPGHGNESLVLDDLKCTMEEMQEELDAINNELVQLTESNGKPTTVIGNSTPRPVEVNTHNGTIRELTNIVNELRTSYQNFVNKTEWIMVTEKLDLIQQKLNNSILEPNKSTENYKEQIEDLTCRVSDLEDAMVNKSSIDQIIDAWKIEQNIHLQAIENRINLTITNGTSHVSHITDGISYNETFKNITNRIHELEMGQRNMVTRQNWITLNETLNLLQRNMQNSSEEITNLVNKTAIEFEKRTIIIQKLSENVSETVTMMKEFKKEQNQKIQELTTSFDSKLTSTTTILERKITDSRKEIETIIGASNDKMNQCFAKLEDVASNMDKFFNATSSKDTIEDIKNSAVFSLIIKESRGMMERHTSASNNEFSKQIKELKTSFKNVDEKVKKQYQQIQQQIKDVGDQTTAISVIEPIVEGKIFDVKLELTKSIDEVRNKLKQSNTDLGNRVKQANDETESKLAEQTAGTKLEIQKGLDEFRNKQKLSKDELETKFKKSSDALEDKLEQSNNEIVMLKLRQSKNALQVDLEKLKAELKGLKNSNGKPDNSESQLSEEKLQLMVTEIISKQSSNEGSAASKFAGFSAVRLAKDGNICGDKTVTYSSMSVNTDRMLDLSSGIVTINKPGIYLLNFNGISTHNSLVQTAIHLEILSGKDWSRNALKLISSITGKGGLAPMSVMRFVKLRKHDKVRVRFWSPENGCLFSGNNEQPIITSFTGMLVEPSTIVENSVIEEETVVEVHHNQSSSSGSRKEAKSQHDVMSSSKPQIAVADDESPLGKYPWQVVILNKSGNTFVAGGVLIGPSHVLTVATSVHVRDIHKELKVRFGVSDTDSNTSFVEKNIKSIVIHPKYNNMEMTFDIALIELASPVEFSKSNPKIEPISLPQKSRDFSGLHCWVSGWGKTSFGNDDKTKNTLKETLVKVFDNDDCDAKLRSKTALLGPKTKFDKGSLCADSESGKGDCIGDVGGPLSCEIRGSWYLAGLLSLGIGCAQKDVPSVYVKVSEFTDWINNNTKIDKQ